MHHFWLWTQGLSIKVNGRMDNHRELENSFLMMAHIIMAHLTKDLFMEKEGLYQAPNFIIRDKLGIMLLKEKDFVSMRLLVILIMDNGWMICQMEKANNSGMMELNIREILLMDLKMEKVL